jgi:hypothetical protein
MGIGLLYYAGHGLQVDWRNFMLPVDAAPTSAAAVPGLCVDTQSVIDAFKAAGNRMNILVLDACRDNPFGAATATKGLAPMDAPPGTYMAYATAPGNVAEDGSDKDGNGLYTRFLVKEIQRPDARIEDVFKRVRFQVRQASQGRQVPWDSSSLEDDFVFASGAKVEVTGGREREAEFAAEKADWDRVKDTARPEELYEFLRRHPNGGIAELASARLERLERARVTAQADRNGETQNPVATRFRMGDRYDFMLKDGLTDQVRSRFTARVTKVTGETAEYENVFGAGTRGASTLAGAVISDGIATFDPPYTLIPGGDYQVGKRWEGRSTRISRDGKRIWMDYSGRVLARERIEIAAGTFDAYRVEARFAQEDGRTQKSTLWVQPDWGLGLKVVIEIRDRSGKTEFWVREMVARERAA